MESCSIRGSHPVIQSILSAADRIAGTDVCVLIVGEKGTGKDLLARYIHAASPRAAGPFVRIDCQELGAVRGGNALTGGLGHDIAGDRISYGLRERARGGTLFLDQISALGNELQARLLSALHAEPAASDVRLLASRFPNDALPSCLAAAGIALVEIPVPPLRQRRSDIPLLVEHFVELYVGRHGVPPRRIDTEAMVQLWQYDWPGNVRELENLVERVVVLNRSGVIRAADLPRHVCTVAAKPGEAMAAAGNGCGIAAGLR